MPEPSSSELLGLAEKYRHLAALRARRDSAADAPPRPVLRDLARQYPGSLRELDTLGQPELQRRAEAARQAAEGGRREPWMSWILSFHRLMAAALFVKGTQASRRRDRHPGEGEGAPLPVAEASAQAGFALSPTLVAELAHPPQGRLVPLVLRELALRSGADHHTLSETLFPSRRRRSETVH